MFERAIVRIPARNFSEGITSVRLGAPVFEDVLAQHAAYCDALAALEIDVVVLDADERFPDSTFVEDTAVVTPRGAMLTRPGAPSRDGEVDAIASAIAGYFDPLERIEAPGTLDGGDICEAGDHFYIGISRRTNLDGAGQLAEFLRALGYETSFVDIRDATSILHLKSGFAYLGGGTFLAIDEIVPRLDMARGDVIAVPEGEEYGANCVLVNGAVLMASGHPKLELLLTRRGYRTVALDMSEFKKMDGGLSCLSLRF